MSDQLFDDLNAAIRESRKKVDLADALERLTANRDFKEVVLVGYLRDYAVKLVLEKAEADNQSPEKQISIIKKLDSIGEFNQFLQSIFLHADIARKVSGQASDELESLLARG